MIGATRLELLSGIKLAKQFAALHDTLRTLDDIPLIQADHELAADFFKRCSQPSVSSHPQHRSRFQSVSEIFAHSVAIEFIAYYAYSVWTLSVFLQFFLIFDAARFTRSFVPAA